MSKAARTESKVVAGTFGGGAGGALGYFLLWLLGVTIWNIPNTAARAGDAVAAVPQPVAGLLLVAVTAVGSFVAAWLAPHTSRTDVPALIEKLAQAKPTPPAE